MNFKVCMLIIHWKLASGFLDNTLPFHIFSGIDENGLEEVRRVPPYFSYKLDKHYKVLTGGSVNLTCIAVGYPMPRVFWKKSDDVFLDDPHTAPIGKNVLTVSNIEKTENFTCVAVSKLGNIETTTSVVVKDPPLAPTNVFIEGVTSSSVTLKWDKVNLLEGERVNKYLIKYRQKAPYIPPSMSPTELVKPPFRYMDSNSFRTKEVSADMNKITVNELEAYTLYEFIIFTVNDIGPGSGSQPREAQTAESTPGKPPLMVQARAMNRGSIYISWTPSEQPNGEIIVVFYISKHPKNCLSSQPFTKKR